MEKKKSFGKKLEAFFAGKGFYIVLILCVAVIGVSAWSMLSDRGTDVDTGADGNSDTSVKAPVKTPAPTPKIGEKVPATVAPEEKPSEEKASGEVKQDDIQETWAEDAAAPSPVFVWPIEGNIEVPYSVESLVYNKTMADWRTHDGIDIACELGAHVMAVSAGVVENVYTDDMYGVTVEISHQGGLKSVYSNLAGTPTVKAGDSVTASEIIGSVGVTALCETGEVNHLHFSMQKDGISVNPTDYLPVR